MKFGLYYLPSFDAAVHVNGATLYQQIFEQVDLGEALGLDCVWCAEHHFTDYGGYIPNPTVLLAAIAQRTKRMQLGTGGVALPINRPLNTAEQLAMVDNLCGGRLDIGVVRAFLNSEYEALNVSMDESRERFNEGLDIILGTWANESFSYDGKFNKFENVRLTPRPVQRKPRIVVGSIRSPESVQNAGRNGFDLMVIPYAISLETTRQVVEMYREALDAAGHDQKDHSVMGPMHMFVDPDESRAKAIVSEPIVRYVGHVRDAVAADKWSKDYVGYEGMAKAVEALMDFDVMYDRRSVLGDPAHAIDSIEAIREAGVDEIPFVTIMPGLAQDHILESMRVFAAEVMPHFKS